MTCETIKNELVAYRDGELPEQDREQIAAHLSTCPACTQEERQLARLDRFLSTLERLTPSPDFEATFWGKVELERQKTKENPLARWWKEWWGSWQMVPALAGAAGLVLFFGYILSNRHMTPPAPSAPTTPSTQLAEANVPPQVVEQPDLFVNYRVIADLDKLAHFEEIAATKVAPDPVTELAGPVGPEDLPPPVLENPGFFVQYPILQKMEELQNLESILALPGEEGKQNKG
jgi:hypothetical protein